MDIPCYGEVFSYLSASQVCSGGSMGYSHKQSDGEDGRDALHVDFYVFTRGLGNSLGDHQMAIRV